MKHSTFVALLLTVACTCTATGLEKIKPHPRLFADAAGFEALKARLATDELVRRGAAYVHRDADKQLAEAIPERKIKDGRRLLSVSHAIGDRVILHAMAYRLFGDRRHLAKAEELMQAAAAFTDWNPSHFLDVAVMSFGVAVGYDWLYGDLPPDSRAAIRAGLVRHGLDPGLAKRNIRRARSNWGQVCSGGVLAAALAVAEDEPEKCRRLLEEVRQDLPRTMAMYRPNGAYPEGPGYWNFGTGYNVRIIAMLESALGDDFGLAAQPCFRETGYYLDFMTGPSGRLFNYSDCSDKRDTSWITWWFARRFGEPGWVEPFEREAYLQELAKVCGRRISPLTLFYLFPRPPDVKVDLPLAWRSDGATDVAVLRSSWGKDGRFAGFKGGKATNPHGHMDGGSFIYEAKGVRWALDFGGENYANAEHAIGMGFWKYVENSPRYRVFRVSANSHNTLLLDGLPHCVAGDVRVVSLASAPSATATLDLSPLFTNATQVIRKGTMLADGFRVSDSVKGLRAGAPIRWAMMTKAKVARDGGDLVLSMEGQTLRLTRNVPPGASDWTVVEEPHGEKWESPNKGFRQILFTVPSVPAGVSFDVTFR